MRESAIKETSWKMFNQIAPTYDRINKILSFGLDLKWRKAVAKNLPSKKNLHILDLATGTGDQLISLFEQGISIQKASGVDLAQNMLSIAEEKLSKKLYRDKVKFFLLDAQKLPFPDQTFDAATCSFGIRNMANPLQSLQEMYRTLKQQGKCLILEFSLPPKPIRGVYLLYLRHVLPRLGALLSKSPNAYSYLNQTIETFPHGGSFAMLMKQAGFNQISLFPMALGAVTLYVGTKK